MANMNTTCSGGSSSVFNSALKAEPESMWTSSMMNTRYFSCRGANWAWEMRSRTFSTLLLLAASISMMSAFCPAAVRQLSQSRQGSPFSGWRQLMALARIRAVVVLPVPREPQNR